MKHIRSAVFLCLALLLAPSFFTFDSDAAQNPSIQISEVYPKEEAFTLKNLGGSEADLKGYRITDGEGSIEFINSVKLAPDQQITIAKENPGNYFDSDDWVITYSSDSLSKKGSFILADSSDELSLILNSDTVDSVCWGNSNGVTGWAGKPAEISSGQHLIRKSTTDTNTAQDWTVTKRGWTTTWPYEYTFSAMVSPFSFPEEEGLPILQTLDSAETSIDISIYLVTSRDVISILCQKAQSGVKVRMLIEGSPLGVDISSELSLLKAVEDAGGEVRLINYSGADNCRYSYVHNKYALIDSDTVIITSENWTAGNIGEYGNRGWGAVIESFQYTDYMRTVFENDYALTWGDVSPLSTVYPNLKAKTDLEVPDIDEMNLTFYESEVTPTVSPDNSFDTLKRFILSSQERLYAEQMDLGGSMSATTGETPIFWMSQISSKEVDTRFVLDCSQTDSDTHTTYLNLIKSTTSIKAIGFYEGEDFDLIHNKGLISDSSVWIGSVNWTDTSFTRNRETAVIINSPDIAYHFADLFDLDYGINIYTVKETGLNLQAQVVDTEGGTVIKLSVDGPVGYKYKWLLSNNTSRETENPFVLFDAPSEGKYLATVLIEGFDIIESVDVIIGSRGEESHDPVILCALALAVLMPCIGAVSYVIRSKNRSRKKRSCGRYRY